MAYTDDFNRARRIARAKMGFYIHLIVYMVVNALLIAVNLATSAEYLWFKWPLLGWGLGLLAHALVTFALPRGAGLQRRLIDREMRKSGANKPQPK